MCTIAHFKRCTKNSDNFCRFDKFLDRKNRNGLCQPSPDVITTCRNAERIFRSYHDKLFKTKNILNILICQTLRSLPSHIFNMNDHIYDQSPLFDHRSQIIKLILKTFFNLRLKHESTKLANSMTRIRMRNNIN